MISIAACGGAEDGSATTQPKHRRDLILYRPERALVDGHSCTVDEVMRFLSLS
jgi:hypothetical protein